MNQGKEKKLGDDDGVALMLVVVREHIRFHHRDAEFTGTTRREDFDRDIEYDE